MMPYYTLLRLKLVFYTVMIFDPFFVVNVLPNKLEPCGSIKSGKINIKSDQRWFKWAQLYSYCKQYNSLSVGGGIPSTFDNGCKSLQCSGCLQVCYMNEESRNITNCEQNCTTTACKDGCRFYSYIFEEKGNNVTFDFNSSRPIIKNRVVNAVSHVTKINLSWSLGNSNDSTTYLISIRSNKDAKDEEYILGLIQGTEYQVNVKDMCSNVYSGFHNELELKFSFIIYPINFVGPTNVVEAKKLNSSIESQFMRPLQLPVVDETSIGSPYFEKSGPTYDYIKYDIDWLTPNISSAKGVWFTYDVSFCTNPQHYREMTKLNHRHHYDFPLEGPAIIKLANTKDDKLTTCLINFELRIRHDDCFLGKPIKKTIKYEGCKTVDGYKNKCSAPTAPPPVLIDTLVYKINVTVLDGTCEGVYLDECPYNNNLTCEYCNKTKYDIEVKWDILKNIRGVQSFTIRWGQMMLPMSIFIDQKSEKRDSVFGNMTTYVIKSVLILTDFELGIQVHAETLFSKKNWIFNSKSIHHVKLNTLDPVPLSPTLPTTRTTTKSNPTTVIAVVVVLLCTAICFVVIFIIYRRRLNIKRRHFRNEELRMEGTSITPDDWEIYPTCVTMDVKIGEGAFGNVYSASMVTSEITKTHYARQCSGVQLMKEITKVAVKFLKEGAQDMECKEFHEEISLMKSIGYHEHIVNLIGCSTINKPLFLVIEYMHYGDLLHYMRKYRKKEVIPTESSDMETAADDEEQITEDCLSPQDVMSFSWQIADGMEYLSLHGIVHRDLAARNILISDEKIIKISDFGLSRYVSDELIYVSNNKTRKLPIKWMSIEAIYHQEFTTASDVWSYGVVLFEIVTLGGTPYPSIGNRELCKMLKSGYRMDKPENCDETVYDIMLHCWNEIPSQRPTFTELREHLEGLVEKGDMYFSFDINESSKYYNVASFKSIPSDDDDELFTKEYTEKPIQIKSLNRSRDSSMKWDEKKSGELRVDIDSNRYFSPQSIIKKHSSLDNPVFENDDG